MAAQTKAATTMQQILTGCGTVAPHPHVAKVRQQCGDKDCRHVAYQYHSCRNRHCPQCGALKKEEWVEARRLELLPIKYYHVVFTLPHELNSIIMGNRAALFKLLFDASAQTLLTFGADTQYLGATPGIISVLHTWACLPAKAGAAIKFPSTCTLHRKWRGNGTTAGRYQVGRR